jgi:hypothetical protein
MSCSGSSQVLPDGPVSSESESRAGAARAQVGEARQVKEYEKPSLASEREGEHSIAELTSRSATLVAAHERSCRSPDALRLLDSTAVCSLSVAAGREVGTVQLRFFIRLCLFLCFFLFFSFCSILLTRVSRVWLQI